MTEETDALMQKLLSEKEEEKLEDKPLEIIDKTPKEKPVDKTSWDEPDPWEFTKMSEKDIEEAEEARNA